MLARAAPGCLDFAQSADPLDAGRINIFERWESAADLEAFRDLPAADDSEWLPPVPSRLCDSAGRYGMLSSTAWRDRALQNGRWDTSMSRRPLPVVRSLAADAPRMAEPGRSGLVPARGTPI